MEEIDLKKYNELTKIDNAIELLLGKIGTIDSIIRFRNLIQQELYTLNVVTLIIMQKEYNMHYQIEDKELDNLYEKVKTVDPKDFIAMQIILEPNRKTINKILRTYYLTRNYIYKRYFNELMVNSSEGKNILIINPFFINNHMEYFCNGRITEEEKIINNVIEYYIEAQRITGNDKCTPQNLKITKEIIIQKHKEKDLTKYILFIISNTYQELMENITDSLHLEMKHIVENEGIKNNDIINYFLANDEFSSIILNRFLAYNFHIKPGRLRELKRKPSYQYSKKLYAN